MLRKLAFKWLGPYQISDVIKDKGTYILKKLDGLQLIDIFAGDRLKKFYYWQRLQQDHTLNLNYKKIPTLSDFLADDNDSDLSDTPNNFIF